VLRIRLTLRRSDDKTFQVVWDADVLSENLKRPDRIVYRKTSRSASGVDRRVSLWDKRRISVTFGAALLRSETGWKNFISLLRAEKIEFGEVRLGKQYWTEYVLKLDEDVEFDHVEDIAELATKELQFIERKPVWYMDWNPV
jgi:hypothetical protein